MNGMNGYDGEAREAYTQLSDALERCRSSLMDAYWNRKRGCDGADILERVDSINKAINGLNRINFDMEDAGIE